MTLRIARLLAAALLAAAVIPVGSAAADPVSSCTPSVGVIVAVDFGHWGGAVQRGCDASPSTGYNALHVAGFSTVGTTHDGPGFICRIDNYPTAAQDSCNRTPPSTAYWSYWHAAGGQNSWSYSSQGAMSYQPPAGSVDAWAFGAGAAPGFSPAQVRASQPASPPAPPPTTRTSAPGGGSAPSAAGSAIAGVSGARRTASRAGTTTHAGVSAAAHPTISKHGTVAATGGSPSASPSASSSGPRIVDAQPMPQARSKSGSPLAVLVTLAVLALLGGGAGWTVWRRRAG